MDRRMVMGIPVTSSWCIKLRQITLNLILLSEFQTNNSTFNQDICLLHATVRNRTCREDEIFAIRDENFPLETNSMQWSFIIKQLKACVNYGIRRFVYNISNQYILLFLTHFMGHGVWI